MVNGTVYPDTVRTNLPGKKHRVVYLDQLSCGKSASHPLNEAAES